MDNYTIQLYLYGVGNKPPEHIFNIVRKNMKTVLSRACENIEWAVYLDDRCEGRILTDSGVDIRPPFAIYDCNPIFFKMHSSSKLATPTEMRELRDVIYEEFKRILGFDFDILIALSDSRLP